MSPSEATRSSPVGRAGAGPADTPRGNDERFPGWSRRTASESADRRGWRRWFPWTVSAGVHAAAAIAILLLLQQDALVHVEPPPEERLIFLEPAPPPPPPLEADRGAPAVQSSGPESREGEIEAARPPEEPTPKVAEARQERIEKPAPTKKRRPPGDERAERDRRRPATKRARSPVPPDHAAPSKEGQPGGRPGGVARGEEGGKPGGLVGGHGDAPIAAELAGRPPVLRSRVLPTYPETARLRGQEGQVVLRAVIDRRGRVESAITVVRSDPVFDAAAIAALRQWVFDPARDREGRPIRVFLTIPLRFQLR